MSDPPKNSVKTLEHDVESTLCELKYQLRSDRYGFRDMHFAGIIARDVLENPAATRDTKWYAKRCARQFGTSSAEIERVIRVVESYGICVAKRKRSRGTRMQEELGRFTGVLPRALALRTPIHTSTRVDVNTENDGEDRYGPVVCSKSLRDTHLGVLAAVCGLWDTRKVEKDHQYVDLTLGELAFLVRSGNRIDKRVSGKDLAVVRDALNDWVNVDIKATMNDRDGNKNYEIPSTPIVRVQRNIGGRWVSPQAYAERYAAGERSYGQKKTVRVWLASWVIKQLTGVWEQQGQQDGGGWKMQRNAVFVSFRVWRGLNATARRLYIWLQGSTFHGSGGQKYTEFYLYKFVKYTLGVRCGHAPELIRRALDQLSYLDQRYHPTAGTSPGWARTFIEGRQFNTEFIRFKVPCWWRFKSSVIDPTGIHTRRSVKARVTAVVKRALKQVSQHSTPAVEDSFIKDHGVGIPPP